MSAARTCRLVTLGCKVNQYETQHLRESLELNGYVEADEHEPADLCVVNTCTVTLDADAKGRQLIRRLNQANPKADIVVMGCYATRDAAAVARLPGVARVITDKARLVEELRDFGLTQVAPGIKRFDGHQRAFVKVQDGCLLNCTYCIIPRVRPDLRSRPAEEIVNEVEGLVAGGCQEIVLTGIHLGHYGIDQSRARPRAQWCRLWHLLDRLARLPGNFRLRLSSLEAAEARDDLVRVMQSHPRICPHLHLCLQSGSDRILQRMRRRYRVAGFLERCRRLREALDQPAFTTDIIVGFPGETEEDFEATCRVVREVGFSRIHVFSFSSRPGTPAAELAEAVPPAVIAERRERILQLEHELAQSYCHSLLGRQLDVLVEGGNAPLAGHLLGTACRYVAVTFPAPGAAFLGQRVPVRAVGLVNGVLLGSWEREDPVTPGLDPQRRIPLSIAEVPLAAVETMVH